MIANDAYWQRTCGSFIAQLVRVEYDSERLGKGEIRGEVIDVRTDSVRLKHDSTHYLTILFESLRAIEAL